MQTLNLSKEPHFYSNLLHQLNGLLVVMDSQSRFIYSNKRTANLFGFSDEVSLLGLNAYDVRCPAVECAERFISQDQYVIQNGEELTILDIHVYSDGQPKVILTKKIPYRENGQVMGSICQGIEIYSDTLNKICGALIHGDKKFHGNIGDTNSNERTYTVGTLLSEKKLSERESDCLFYLLRGKTMKQIGKMLEISPRTVETYLDQIKVKLNCSSKADLVEYGFANGYLNYIPSSILPNNLSNIIHAG